MKNNNKKMHPIVVHPNSKSYPSKNVNLQELVKNTVFNSGISDVLVNRYTTINDGHNFVGVVTKTVTLKNAQGEELRMKETHEFVNGKDGNMRVESGRQRKYRKNY